MAEETRIRLKSYFETGDKPTAQEFIHLIDSMVHKYDGIIITSVMTNDIGDITFSFSDGNTVTVNKYQLPNEMPVNFIAGLQTALDSKVDKVAGKQLSGEDFTTVLKAKLEQLENYVHPDNHGISEISGLQTALDNKVSKTANETISGNKIFSELLQLDSGLKFSNFTGSGLKNLVVQNDGTISSVAIAADVFVSNTTYDDITKKLTLTFTNGTNVDVDLSGLEEDLTGLQASITSLQSSKLDKGSYSGSASDLDAAKRNKTAQAKSITDSSGNLELVGDIETPGNDAYYGTDHTGSKTFVKALDVLNFITFKKDSLSSSSFDFIAQRSILTDYLDQSLSFSREGKYAFMCNISVSASSDNFFYSDFNANMFLDSTIELDSMREEFYGFGVNQRHKRSLFGIANVTPGTHNFKLTFDNSLGDTVEMHKAEVLVFKIGDNI